MKAKNELLIERIRSATNVIGGVNVKDKNPLSALEQAAATFLIQQYEDSTEQVKPPRGTDDDE